MSFRVLNMEEESPEGFLGLTSAGLWEILQDAQPYAPLSRL